MTRMLKQSVPMLTAWLLAAGLGFAANAGANQAREWRFTVFLDNKEIGYHHFSLKQFGRRQRLDSEARFKVKFLLFDAYRYEHNNVEWWQGDCLAGIQSRTNDNGETFSVQGGIARDRFTVETGLDDKSLPPCVVSFAYWDPALLARPRLLNAQTGEYVEVTVAPMGPDTLTVRGEPVAAYRYRLSGEDLKIDLWYSPDNHWLALESTLEGGRKLRYRMQ